ncbi:SOS response-associated peptidase family protein [Paracoccus sp. SSK6]|uniref:SOS response-associated peptidase n=1 Tax=Paracoccus sp. SSK6 TaxID=3143131 RepID=UPI00321C0F8E
MCNLYAQIRSQDDIRQTLAEVIDTGDDFQDLTGNLPAQPGIFPDYAAPIVRRGPSGGWQLARARWGMPSPAFALKGKRTDPGVTNIRNTASPYWRRWLGAEHRCLVPFTSFSEIDGRSGAPRNHPVWFALDDDRPLAFFAGLWTGWTSVRKLKEGEVTADLYGFLTCDPNAEVRPVHPKAMPVILTRPEEWRRWLTAPAAEALALQRPLPDGLLRIVAEGAREDGG